MARQLTLAVFCVGFSALAIGSPAEAARKHKASPAPQPAATAAPKADYPPTATPGQRLDGLDVRDFWQGLVATFWLAEVPDEQKLESLEQACDGIIRDKQRTLDGRWSIDFYEEAVMVQINRETTDPEAPRKDLELIRKWQSLYPASKCAPLVESQYWSAYAWHARGGGWASSVTPEGWRIFKERLTKADNILDSRADLASINPQWYSMKIEIGLGLQRPKEEMLAVLAQGLKAYPEYYQDTLNMIRHFTPKWGGSWELVDAFVETVVEITEPKLKATMYTRLYWNIYKSDKDLREKGIPNWERMRVGFEDLRKAYPKSLWITNHMAAFACEAHDGKTYATLRPQIMTGRIYRNAWASNVPMDVCDVRFKLNQPI